MWEYIASPKRQQKSLWCAVPSVKKTASFSHSLGHNRTFARQEKPDMKPGYSSSEGLLLYGVYQIGEV